jgi:putative transposase
MAQSLANVVLHIVFSTKYRHPWITADIEGQLHRYLTTICNALGCHALQVGGTEDHIHNLCRLSRTLTIAKLVETLKRSSSRWLKTIHPRYLDFSWQNGYGAFSVSASQIPRIRDYIVNQKQHHRRMTFEDEFRELLSKYEAGYDERYLWD